MGSELGTNELDELGTFTGIHERSKIDCDDYTTL